MQKARHGGRAELPAGWEECTVAWERTASVQELETFVLDRAARDPQFRRALLADPREAISRELGIELPGTVVIEARETGSEGIALLLPPNLGSLDGSSLARAQLGDDCCCCC